MEFRYLGTFISGLQDVIEKILLDKISDCKIIKKMDGAIVFSTNKDLNELNVFNNLFIIINEQINSDPNKAIESHIKIILKNTNILSFIKKINHKNQKSFRIIFSNQNQLISINKPLKTNIEKLIQQNNGLELDRSLPDTEYWFLYRSEGISYFLKRITKHTSYEKILNKGELRPEISYILNWLSKPNKDDICLDPFCGYGAIVYQRLSEFKTNKFYAFDIDEKMIDNVKAKSKEKYLDKLIIKVVDVKNIHNHVEENSIDCIVTDPPWGIFEKIDNIEGFYLEFLTTFSKLLKNNGRLVLLTAKKQELINSIEKIQELTITEQYDILVSGKKSAVYCINKKDKIQT